MRGIETKTMDEQKSSGVIFADRLPVSANVLYQMVVEFTQKANLLWLDPDESYWHDFSVIWEESTRVISIEAKRTSREPISGLLPTLIDVYYETGGKDAIFARISYSYNQLENGECFKR